MASHGMREHGNTFSGGAFPHNPAARHPILKQTFTSLQQATISGLQRVISFLSAKSPSSYSEEVKT